MTISRHFDEIADNPRGADSKKLDGGIYRVRVGHYRIVYEVRDKERQAVNAYRLSQEIKAILKDAPSDVAEVLKIIASFDGKHSLIGISQEEL